MELFWADWCAACDSVADLIIPNLPYILMLSFALAFPMVIIINIFDHVRRKK